MFKVSPQIYYTGEPIPGTPLQQGAIPYPISTDIFTCPNCNTDNNLKNLRLQIEAKSGRKVVG